MIHGTYSIHVQADTFGCGVDLAILHLDRPVDAAGLQVSVTATKLVLNWGTFRPEPVDHEREVLDVFCCDAEGKASAAPSEYLAVRMAITPDVGTPYYMDLSNMGRTEWSDPYYLTFRIDGMEIERDYTAVSFSTDFFRYGSYSAKDGKVFPYAIYSPQQPTKTLVVWLHGLGEGGSDPRTIVNNANVSALTGEAFQSILHGAHIFAPQCPTYWMDGDGSGSSFAKGRIFADGTSFYTEALHEMIEAFRTQLGAEKVIIAGCSNGGYMALVLAMEYGKEYAAYVPICEAMEDRFISDEQIDRLRELPLYFIFARNDPLVPPAVHELPTLKRLQDAGAKELLIFAPADVHDTTGRFFGKNGQPYQYFGHASWQYFFGNDAVTEDGVNCWQWMSDHANA